MVLNSLININCNVCSVQSSQTHVQLIQAISRQTKVNARKKFYMYVSNYNFSYRRVIEKNKKFIIYKM